MRHSFDSTLRAQMRVLPILATTLSLPGARRPSPHGKRPKPTDTLVAGCATTVFRPSGASPWPSLVFVNGATPDGRNHPTVRRLGSALAQAGVMVYVPDLSGISGGELSPETLAQSTAVAAAAAGSSESAGDGSRSPVCRSVERSPS